MFIGFEDREALFDALVEQGRSAGSRQEQLTRKGFSAKEACMVFR